MLSLPRLGLGTLGLTGELCRSIVGAALAEGYCHIDTARKYGNEEDVGRAVSAAAVSRDDVIITTKLDRNELTAADVERATLDSLRRLHVDYIDVLLIHWPNLTVPLAESLEAMVALRDRGVIRAIGVANFTVPLLSDATRLVPDLITNQVEYHPYLSQEKVLARCRQDSLSLTAYCPLARGAVLDEEVVLDASSAHRLTPAQTVLRWLIDQSNVVAIPATSNPSRLRENIETLQSPSLESSAADAISSLAKGGRLVSPPFAPRWD